MVARHDSGRPVWFAHQSVPSRRHDRRGDQQEGEGTEVPGEVQVVHADAAANLGQRLLKSNSGHQARLAEGIIGGSSRRGFADDDVIEEMDLHQAGGFDEAAGDHFIGAARAGIAGGMVVDQDETMGAAGDHRAQDFPWMGGGFAHGADRDDVGADVAQPGIQHGDDDLLLREMPELGREKLVNALRGVERDIAHLFAGDAGAEFEGGGEFRGFGEPEPAFFRQFRNGQSARARPWSRIW